MPSVIDKIVDKYRPEIVVNHHDALTDSIREAVSLAFAEAFLIASQWPCGGIDPSTNATETREAYIQRMMEIARKGAK